MKKLTLFLFLIFFLQACSQDSSSNKKQTPLTLRQLSKDGVEFSYARKTDLAEDLSNLTSFKEDLNKFVVEFYIKGKPLAQIRVLKVDKYTHENSELSHLVQSVSTNSWNLIDEVDLSEGAGAIKRFKSKELTYEIFDGEKKLTQFEVNFIPDLFIAAGEVKTLSDLNLDSGTFDFGYLVLGYGSSLVTEGKSITFNVQKLITFGAIETFTKQMAMMEGPEASRGQNGGAVAINALEANGNLEVFLRGTVGGRGRTGDSNKNAGAAGADGKMGVSGHNHPDPSPRCKVQSTPGEQGKQGPEGGPGGNGGNGGDSGTFKYSGQKNNSLYLKIHTLPGPGGIRGEGGTGGPGGPGGKGVRDYYPCPATPAGAQGKAGDPGKPGQPGSSGTAQDSCVSLHKHEETICKVF
ncbi:collagen-like triple helix repeat-containing protein [Bdellovibrio reynosensis]|uniref:Collagen-like protein n=1 Tax=Bdellovibrio reynosensis TaxID=2835041 RepID=A0ABY4CG25_9BACT|nr:collagen-like protein [Bdellovibrio reynosensis]UOF02626.1 collagen-like protein [Bdellovibrio reynosensis]